MIRSKPEIFKSLWKESDKILDKFPDVSSVSGVEVKKLWDQIDNVKYTKELFEEFVNVMHEKHRFFAFTDGKPTKIVKRRPIEATKLIKLDATEYAVYNHIEKSQREGIPLNRISDKIADKSSKDIKMIIEKVLEKQQLTARYTNPRTMQVFYHVTRYKPKRENVGNSIFIGPKGDIDNAFLKDIKNVIEHQIKASDARTGMSSLELQRIIKGSGLVKDENGIPLNDIELILQLLVFENRIRIVAESLPKGQLSQFLTPSKNTFYHLVKGIQEMRNKRQDRIQREVEQREKERKRKLNRSLNAARNRNEKDLEPLLKKRKLNPIKRESDKMKIEIEVDHSDGNDSNSDEDSETKQMRSFGNIRFRYNHYEYSSPFSQIPCQSCPVANECSDDGIVNPTDCPYLNAWLDVF